MQATLIYLFTIIYIWMWIFQAVKIEKLKLEEKMFVGKLESLKVRLWHIKRVEIYSTCILG